MADPTIKQWCEKISTFLGKEEIEFLQKITAVNDNHPISISDAIAAFVSVAMSLGISLDRIQSKRDLIDRMLQAIAAVKSDRRKFPRFRKHLDISFRKMDSMVHYRKTLTRDVSLGGFRMDLSCLGKPPTVDEVIEITLSDPDHEKSQSISAIGKIVWVRVKDDEEAYEVGVHLTYIKKEHQENFLNCLTEDPSV